VAAEPVSSRELGELHERISAGLAELRGRLRRQTAAAPRLPEDVAKAAADVLRSFRASSSLAAGIGVALLAVAGAAAAVMARRRSAGL
jgi:hypothetical protein